MDARRDDVADGNNGNENCYYHAWYSLLTHARTARSPVPPYTRAGYRDSGESGPPPRAPGLDLTPSTYSLAQSNTLWLDM
jgi:hypothetical protein